MGENARRCLARGVAPSERLPLVVFSLAVFLVQAAGCKGSGGDRPGEGPGHAAVAGAWTRFDLWAVAPEVERLGEGAGRWKQWSREVAYLGPADVRDPAVVGRFHFQSIPYLPASEVRALEQRAGSKLRWRLELGSEPYLSFVPLRDEAHPDAWTYRVAVREPGGREREVARRASPPPVPPAPATEVVDLAYFAGQAVELLLEILPGEGSAPPANPRALWASPAVYGRRPLEGPVPGSAARPNVLLIGADTLRADALGAYGASPSVTPALDALAAESDVWLDAVSCFNVTNPSFISTMTGLYGKNHGIYDLGSRLPAERVTLAELFSAAGYDTKAILSARHLGDQASGLGQGFAEVLRTDRRFAAELGTDAAISWIAERAAPFFLWLHLFDPHTPHTPPAPFYLGLRPVGTSGLAPVEAWTPFREPGTVTYTNPRLGGHRELYRGEAAYLDRQIDRLMDFLASHGLLETTLVVFLSDHGENLEDHGVLFAHHGLFETTTRVPLMIRWPGESGEPRGRRIEGLVQNVDLFPTLVAAVGLPAAETGLDLADLDGEDLRTLTMAPRSGRRAAFSEHAHRRGVRVRTREWAYMRSVDNPFIDEGTYLFDIGKDPDETENLAGRGLPEEAELAGLLDRWLRARRRPVQPLPPDLDPEEVERLRGLGYAE